MLINKEIPSLNLANLDSTQFFHFVLNVNTLEKVWGHERIKR